MPEIPEWIKIYKILYLDEKTVIFQNDQDLPFIDPADPSETLSASVIAFDIDSSCVSATAEFTEDKKLKGEILFGLGGFIEADSPSEMACQIEIYVDGFSA